MEYHFGTHKDPASERDSEDYVRGLDTVLSNFGMEKDGQSTEKLATFAGERGKMSHISLLQTVGRVIHTNHFTVTSDSLGYIRNLRDAIFDYSRDLGYSVTSSSSVL